MIAHADVPPSVVQGRKAAAFVDYYLGVKTHKDGSFDHWFKIPCNGKCHIITVGGTAASSFQVFGP